MQILKKRIRLLVEELNGTIAYGHDGSIEVCFEYGAAKFSPASIETMVCRVDLGDGPQTFSLEKCYCFDIADRLGTSHLAGSLRDYRKRQILQMDDYISEERGAPYLRSLQKEIADNSALVRKELGGNRILAEYYCGVLILRDDLRSTATNVVEFSATSPIIRNTRQQGR